MDHFQFDIVCICYVDIFMCFRQQYEPDLSKLCVQCLGAMAEAMPPDHLGPHSLHQMDKNTDGNFDPQPVETSKYVRTSYCIFFFNIRQQNKSALAGQSCWLRLTLDMLIWLMSLACPCRRDWSLWWTSTPSTPMRSGRWIRWEASTFIVPLAEKLDCACWECIRAIVRMRL